MATKNGILADKMIDTVTDEESTWFEPSGNEKFAMVNSVFGDPLENYIGIKITTSDSGYNTFATENAMSPSMETNAYPNEITVTTFADVLNANDGLTSLREAILASADGIRDKTIVLGEGTYTLSRNGTESDATRDLDIHSNLTLVGQGADLTTIDGKQLDRIFDVFPNVTLTLSNLTITNGLADKGGAIYNRGTVNLAQTVLRDNAANSGGAVYNEQAGVAAIADSEFLYNRADGKEGNGGGTGHKGSHDSTPCLYGWDDSYSIPQYWAIYCGEDGGKGGDGDPGTDAKGGAIYNAANGSLTLANSHFTNNDAKGGEGGDGGNGGDGGIHVYSP